MKKILLIISVIMILALSVSCTEVAFIDMDGDWPSYRSTEELLEKADYVFVAEIADIAFSVLDVGTGTSPTEETEWKQLYTLYKVDIKTTYKGDTSNIEYFKVMGGLKGYKAEEQLRIAKEGESNWWQEGIFVWAGYNGFAVGEEYLLVLCKGTSGRSPYPVIINPWETGYCLSNKTLQVSTTPNNITAEDIVKTFGEDKLAEFTAKYR